MKKLIFTFLLLVVLLLPSFAVTGEAAKGTAEVIGGPARTYDTALVYPNPFNPGHNKEVVIQYRLSKNLNVDIYLISISGQRIKKLSYDSGAKGGRAGLNKVTWDGSTNFGGIAANAIYLGTIVNRDDDSLLDIFKLIVRTL